MGYGVGNLGTLGMGYAINVFACVHVICAYITCEAHMHNVSSKEYIHVVEALINSPYYIMFVYITSHLNFTFHCGI